MKDFLTQAQELTQTLTLKEKIGQIAQVLAGFECYNITADGEIEFSDEFETLVKEYGGIGQISALLRADPWTGRHYDNGITIEMREKIANKIQRYVEENTRAKIPVLIDLESSHGLQALGSVMYPTGLCNAASFNPELYEKMMDAIGQELKLSGNHVAFLTLIDLARDPRWGRSEECLGEDPLLASRMAAAAVKGVKHSGTLACAKHFAAAGSCEGGVNSAEIHMGQRELNEIGLSTAKACVDAGCDVVMVAYNSVDGTLVHVSKHLLKDVLRDQLHFDGIIMSDGTGVNSVSGNLEISQEDAAVLCLQSGIELSLADMYCFTQLEQAVQKGNVDVSLIDNACAKVLAKKFEMGLFDNRYVEEGGVMAFNKDHHCEQIAYEMAAESITMIKNDGTLPLHKKQRVLIVGENAVDIYHMLGDYTSDRKEGEGTTIWQAIRDNFDNATFVTGWNFGQQLTQQQIDQTLQAAQNSDVIVFCAGGTSKRDFETVFQANGALAKTTRFMDCGEGADLANLNLCDSQMQLLQLLSQQNKPIVSVVAMGRAYCLQTLVQLSNAVLIAYYPGQEGGCAVCDVLTGTVNPSGKLPVTLPTTVGALPVCHDQYPKPHRYMDCENPVLYPFGYGLSYSEFVYSDLVCTADSNGVHVEFCIENTSDTDGKEVVQLYFTPSGDGARQRKNQLKDFCKVAIQAGEKKKLTFDVAYQKIGFINPISPMVEISVGPEGHEHLPKIKLTLNKNEVL